MTMIHITEERLLELVDMKADELFAAIEEIKADPIQKTWVYDAEEAASHDMAALIERQDRLLKLADGLASANAKVLRSSAGIPRAVYEALRAYRTARGQE